MVSISSLFPHKNLTGIVIIGNKILKTITTSPKKNWVPKIKSKEFLEISKDLFTTSLGSKFSSNAKIGITRTIFNEYITKDTIVAR